MIREKKWASCYVPGRTRNAISATVHMPRIILLGNDVLGWSKSGKTDILRKNVFTGEISNF